MSGSEQGEDWRNQHFAPEFIARVKEEHTRQTSLTAESVMVLAYRVSRQVQGLVELRDRLTAVVSELGRQVLLPEEMKREGLSLAVSSAAVNANACAVALSALATLASELARLKLKEINVE